MSEPEWTLGQVAYDAYCELSNNVSLVSGVTLPRWDEQRPEIQRAWAHVGETVVRTYLGWRIE